MRASTIFASLCVAMVAHTPLLAQQIRPNSPSSLPSDGGKKSGGGSFLPGGGRDFRFPGNGGGGSPVFRPRPGGWTPQPNPRPVPGGQWQPQPQPIYGQPIQSQPFPTSTTISPSIPSAPVSTSQYVVIRCPQTARGSIYYRLESGGRNYGFTMRPGQEQRFRVSSDWSISYSDGTQQKRYRLRGGKTYTLKNTNGGRWQLYSVRSAGS